MLIYAGIDEAGYGPMLGPLCVAATAFVVSDHDADPGGDICDLWKKLNRAVCRKRTDKRRRIAVDDSKKLKLPNDFDSNGSHPLKHLERGVLSFLGAGRESASVGGSAVCDCDDQLFGELSVTCSTAPWYSSSTPLPVAHSEDELRIAINRLRRTLADEGVACALMRCEAIDAEAFNCQVELMGVKSSVNFCAVMRHIDAIWKRWPHDSPHIVVDRQGGRTHYLRDLMISYPEAHVQILEETELLSQYRVEQGGSSCKISFAVEAESAYLPVALASMVAKYVRELFMIRLNRYFQGLMPELKATAGYTEDARRYLAQIDPLIASLGVDRRSLVRSL
jgi:ribonuclease HII